MTKMPRRKILPPIRRNRKRDKLVIAIVATWVALNGVAAIMYGILHIHFGSYFGGLYFVASDKGAWLNQHGVIIGVALIYLSRHLARGEQRARQLFLILCGLELLKYSVFEPSPVLLVIYFVSFVAVWRLKYLYTRASVLSDWHVRIRDILLIISGVGVAVFVSVLLIDLLDSDSSLVSVSVEKFGNFIFRVQTVPKRFERNALLVDILTAALGALLWFVLWSLFRPARFTQPNHNDQLEDVQNLLESYGTTSEDFFKLWPDDKAYFWSEDRQGFIAYKVEGAAAFALADPIAPTESARARLLKNFTIYCRSKGWRACFLPTELSDWYKQHDYKTIQIGANAVVNVEEFTNKTVQDKWWRWRRNKAKKSGYTYQVIVPPHSTEVLHEIKSVSDAWLQRDGHQEQSFAMGYFDYEYINQCALHLLRDESGSLIAFTNQVPVFNDSTQTTIDLIRFLPDADNAMPILLMNFVQKMHEGGIFKTVDLGFVPMAQVKNSLTRTAMALGGGRISTGGLEQFKNKFDPAWHNLYLAFDGDIADIAVIALNLEKALEAPQQN